MLQALLPDGAVFAKTKSEKLLVRLSNGKYRKFCERCGCLKSITGRLCMDCSMPEKIERSRSFGYSLKNKKRSSEAVEKGTATARANGTIDRNIARLAEGNKGRKASPEHVAKIIKSNKERILGEETRQKHVKAGYKLWEKGKGSSRVGTGRRGFRVDIPGVSFRSSWEANFARFLNYVGIKWRFEPFRFKLSTGESYCPDFLLENETYIEIKGYWSERAKRIVALFRNEYPNIKLCVLDESKYKKFKTKWSGLENWE